MPGKVDTLVLLCNGTAGHLHGVHVLILARPALRVIVQKAACTQGEARKVGLLDGRPQVCIFVIRIICVSHQESS
nr:MAG TPA: hypothetical protein [Caudoviricetes sp.]